MLFIIKNKDPSQWQYFYDDIISKMKELYRSTWSVKVAEAMANCPNLMMYDDHEIHNNFGYKESYNDLSKPDSYICSCARRVYYEYQRQLREDIDFIDFQNVTSDYWSCILNGVGFYFLDHRGSRSWYKDLKDNNFFGKPQLKDIESSLREKFASCAIVIVLCTNPLVLHTETESKNGEEIEEFIYNDVKGYEKFLNMLHTHKQVNKQEVFLLGVTCWRAYGDI